MKRRVLPICAASRPDPSRRRALGWLIASPWVTACGGGSVELSVGAPPDPIALSLAVDFSRALGPFAHPPGGALSATPGRSAMNDLTWQRLAALKLKQVRLWMMFDWFYDTTTKQATPTRRDSVMAPYFKKYGDIAEQLLVCLDFPRYYRDLVTGGRWLEQEYLDAYRTALRDYKTRFPKMEFLEVGNEPDATQWTPLQTYEMYQKVCALVAPLNADIAAGRLPGPSLKMGGPTLYKLDDTQVSKWLSPFLALYAADASPNKRLDFISYHQYLLRESTTTQPPEIFKTQPARAAQDRRLIDTALAANGLTPGLPVMVTEGGIYAAAQPNPVPESNYFIKATGQLALDYQFLASADIVPYRWTVDSIEANKALFVLDDSGKSTGQTRPFYHATAFERQLPSERVFATGDLDAQGQGVGVLAGTSAQRVGVLIWNYQFYDQGDRTFYVNLKALPPELAGGRMRLTVRAIRRTQSQGDPLLERDELLTGLGPYSLKLSLKANEFLFVEVSAVS